MSKERELLKRVIDALHEIDETHYDLFWDIKAYLDQPEAEPVAWQIVKNVGHKPPLIDYLYSKPREQVYENYKVTELYKGSND